MKKIYGTFGGSGKYEIPEGYIFVVTTFDLCHYKQNFLTNIFCNGISMRFRKFLYKTRLFELFLVISNGLRLKYQNFRSSPAAYYFSFEKAEKAILNNYGDLCEGRTNEWVVIEAIQPGVCPEVFEVQWYYWSRINEKYITFERPDKVPFMFKYPNACDYFGCINFGLG
jgi:hypothetical protein